MNRKHSPLHDFWHRRVDGQIRHTINHHPEWFNFATPRERETIVNSLAKRIVGEIVACYDDGRELARVRPVARSQAEDAGAWSVSASVPGGAVRVLPGTNGAGRDA